MTELRAGRAIRALRLRRGWRQSDLARAACVSASSVSRAEAGRVDDLRRLRAIAAPLDLRLDVVPRWRGGELDRLLNARHSAMHEALAGVFAGLTGWTSLAEVSFAYGMERGIVDVLAWHAAARALLVVELKTEIVDVQEMLGTLDRKTRLAPRIGRERGWPPALVGTWLVVAESTRNREHVRAHRTVLSGRLPAGATEMHRWLAAPHGAIGALTFLRSDGAGGAGAGRPGRAGGSGRSGRAGRSGRSGATGRSGGRDEGRDGGRDPDRGAAREPSELRPVQPVVVTHGFAPRKRVRLPAGASQSRPRA